jgi:hypothetical protein
METWLERGVVVRKNRGGGNSNKARFERFVGRNNILLIKLFAVYGPSSDVVNAARITKWSPHAGRVGK